MRSEFRFPRSAIFLMLVILGGMILAIGRVRNIQLQHSTITNATPDWPALLGLFVLVFVLLCAAGAAGYAILFALRRAGVHRFSNVQTWSARR